MASAPEGGRRVKTKIRELRAKMGLTQEELAQQVGVRRETIVFLEKGKYNPSLKLAYKVARALGSTIEEVFTFEDEDLA
jgi:putative transcriptional regulator|nr:helix-turn-helix transcriptional regulator [Methanoculleus sp. 7T]